MYETSTALDPVAAFEFYLSKTHPDCKALFQTPNKATTKNINFASTRHWYRNEPMGKNTISKMMESRVIGAVHETLHSCIDCHFFVPARCGRKEICAITKHNLDERSLSHYISETTSAQKRERSKILSDTFQPQLAVQQEASGITRHNVASPSAGPSSNLNPQSLLQNQFISLAQPYQNCTQHIQIGTMNIYQGKYEEPSPSTRKRRRIIGSDDSD